MSSETKNVSTEIARSKPSSRTGAGKTAVPSKEKLESQLTAQRDEAQANVRAVLKLTAATELQAVEDITMGVLAAISETFGWAYGSFWKLNAQDRQLRAAGEVGVVNAEFRRLTTDSGTNEGASLCGRAWRQREAFVCEAELVEGLGDGELPQMFMPAGNGVHGAVAGDDRGRRTRDAPGIAARQDGRPFALIHQPRRQGGDEGRLAGAADAQVAHAHDRPLEVPAGAGPLVPRAARQGEPSVQGVQHAASQRPQELDGSRNGRTFDGRDAAEIPARVDAAHVAIRYGHFYAHRAIAAMGLLERSGIVRVSMVHYNTPDEVGRLIAALDAAL